jgi:hypothetical protein
MKRLSLLIPVVFAFTASCNFPRPTEPIITSETENPSVLQTASAQTGTAAAPRPTADWTGGTFRIETEDLIIDYPDFVDRAEAQKQADTLQKGYEIFLSIFAFGGEKPYDGIKTNIVFDPKADHSSADRHLITISLALIDVLKNGYVNPPDPTYFHEMVHVFEWAELYARRFYLFHMFGGVNESFAELLKCHPDVIALLESNAGVKAHCDALLNGIDAKSPEDTLAYYEAQKIDPYALDWGTHPPVPNGEMYFMQMLARVSYTAGWDVWGKYFAATLETRGSPAVQAAMDKKVMDMRDPLAKQAFAEFVSSLSDAAGQDLRPMFRGWGFDL